MSTRTAQVTAACLSFAFLWLEVAALFAWLAPENRQIIPFVAVAAAATACAAYFWRHMAAEAKMVLSPGAWLGMFALAAAISFVFVEMDCGGSLRFVDGLPTCSHVGGGISIVFTIGALALMIVSLPNALRAWLIRMFDSGAGPRA
jgi:hypothetical protein